MNELQKLKEEVERLKQQVTGLQRANTRETETRRTAQARVQQLEVALYNTMRFVETTAAELRRLLSEKL